MTGGRTAPRLAMIAVVGLVCGIVTAGAAHAQDDPAVLNAEVERLYQAGKYPEATEIAKRLLAIGEKLLGPDHTGVSQSLNNLALLYQAQGRYAEAEPLYKRSLAIYEMALGSDHPSVATLINNLAELYRVQGRNAEAEPLYKRSLAIDETALGPEHPNVATLINNLALLYHAEGRNDEAEPLHKRSLAIRENALGPEHPDVGQSLNNLAELYLEQGRYAEAEPLCVRSLAIDEKALGSDHPNVGVALSNLAKLYQSRGRYADAEPPYKRSLAIREKALGPDHPDVASSLSNLADLYLAQGRYAEAEPLHTRSISIYEKSLGSDHPHISTALSNLASLHQNLGRYGEAEQLFKRSLAISEKALGPDHPTVAMALNNLAELYRTQGRYAEAEPSYKRCLAITEKALGQDHPKVGVVLSNLAQLYSSQGRYLDAARLYIRSRDIREKSLGPDHPDVGIVVNNMADLYALLGYFAEAEPLYKRSLEIFQKSLGSEHLKVGAVFGHLAFLYTRQGRYADAEPLFMRGLGISEKALGLEHPDVAVLLNNLAELYREQGRYTDAEPLYERSLAINEKELGPDHPFTAFSLSNLARLAFARYDWAGAAAYWRRSTSVIQRRSSRSIADGRLEEAGRDEAQRLAVHFSAFVKATHRVALQGSVMTLTKEMFETAQRAQTSEAAASLAQMAARSARGSPNLAEFVRERQDLASEWRVQDEQLIAAKSKTPATRVADAERALANRLNAIETRLAEIDRRLAQDFPDYTAFASPASLSVAEVQAQLNRDEALVLFLDTPELAPVPEETFVWIVTKSDVRWVRSDLGTAALTREVAALRCGLDATAWEGGGAERCSKAFGIPLDKAPGPNEPLPFDHVRAHNLYSALFGRVQNLIKDKHLLIVPSGPLTQLPFQVLVTKPPTSSDHRAVAWLARDHAVTVLPAASSLTALRRVGKPSAASKPMIGFGNPLLDGPDARYANRAKLARGHQRCSDGHSQQMAAIVGHRGGVFRVETRSALADVSHIKMQVPLPETADELCAVAQDVKAGSDDIRLGVQATEHQIKQLSASGELAKYRLLHFATHGVLAGQLDGAHEPGLILTPPDKATEEDDGYLSASEIAALKLDADWVILSACNTAAGGATSAEALSGLARAFIYAQARALLVSHWAVYSNATVKLITTAIRETTRDPKVGRAEALRRSMLALIDKGEPHEAHPAYWAPFVVVGEGGAINAGGSPTNNVAPSRARKIVRKPVRETRDWATDLLRPN